MRKSTHEGNGDHASQNPTLILAANPAMKSHRVGPEGTAGKHANHTRSLLSHFLTAPGAPAVQSFPHFSTIYITVTQSRVSFCERRSECSLLRHAHCSLLRQSTRTAIIAPRMKNEELTNKGGHSVDELDPPSICMHQPDGCEQFDFLEDVVLGEKPTKGFGSQLYRRWVDLYRPQPALAWLVRLWMATAVALEAGPSYRMLTRRGGYE